MLFSKPLQAWILFIVLQFHSTSGRKDYQLETATTEGAQREGISGSDVYVSTSLGKLRGKRRSGSIGSDVDADVFPFVDCFLGVPYATPPTTKLRFQKTKSAQPWAGTRDASQFQATCPQRFVGNRFEDEDCLYLNIYTPVKVT